ncbi:MAG: YbhB/YbcL family Raf kinase inhibitor-like protein [Acidimicrobiales bacterium]|nr:YbhB/YbcL family Raf kinase inhibitor-like protein [Acidimicrobiales bacterium]
MRTTITPHPLFAAVACTLALSASCGNDRADRTAATAPVPTTSAAAATTTPPNTGTTTGAAPSSGQTMRLAAAEFSDGGEIPKAHVCTNQGGANEGPTLTWTGVPDDATTLVLVMHDPDAPLQGGFTHWIARLEPRDGTLKPQPVAGAQPPDTYFGPCPPPGAPHHYEFTLYAFGPEVTLPAKPTKADIDQVAAQALATAKLTGVYANPG